MPTVTVKLSDDDYAILEGLRGDNETKSEVIRLLLRRNKTVIPEPGEVSGDVLDVLREQLRVKDEQISGLNKALLAAQETAKAAQVLQAAEKQPAMLERENKERQHETWRDRVRRWFAS